MVGHIHEYYSVKWYSTKIEMLRIKKFFQKKIEKQIFFLIDQNDSNIFSKLLKVIFADEIIPS